MITYPGKLNFLTPAKLCGLSDKNTICIWAVNTRKRTRMYIIFLFDSVDEKSNYHALRVCKKITNGSILWLKSKNIYNLTLSKSFL